MMFVLSNVERAKRVARDLSRELKEIGIDLGWSKAMEVVAWMYGYGRWNDLVRKTGSAPASNDDDLCPPEEAEERRKTQEAALLRLGLSHPQAAELVSRLQPTSRSRKRKEEDLPPRLRFLLFKAKSLADSGFWDDAADCAAEGLKAAIGGDRDPFVTFLKQAAQHSDDASVNLAMAFLIGDAGRKDVAMAKALLEQAAERSEDPHVLAHALAALGDIAGGCHGHDHADPKMALEHWSSAAELGSSEGAFNAGLSFANMGDAETAAAFYEMAVEADHAGAMVNLAGLILAGAVPGSADRLEQLYRRAASMGDHLARSALANIGPLRREATWAQEEKVRRFEQMEAFMRTAGGYDPAIWSEVLTGFGWKIEGLDVHARGEGAQVFVAVAADGKRKFPAFMSAASYSSGDDGDSLARDLKKKLARKKDAILIFHGSGSVMIGENPRRSAICPGQIKVDGKWTDFFLAKGGLEEAIRQNGVLSEGERPDDVEPFILEDAIEIACRFADTRFKVLDELFGDDDEEYG